ncbi:unnamed protein product [[Candida] boidinii]|uniref:Unnamed protein product n=1 Tax=Candida boidinii TaxID=5477 RepID=A0A9W6WI94_CANBO|nr:hypothetical protein B5S30_g1578 [[Candida] boidinii]OWB84974.1 hypothetical protein B5S33_g3631 [[Candida] boidinii]GME71333.1 unnamed protein product [[Candida] boidinii]
MIRNSNYDYDENEDSGTYDDNDSLIFTKLTSCQNVEFFKIKPPESINDYEYKPIIEEDKKNTDNKDKIFTSNEHHKNMNSHINRQISGENNNDRKHLNINGYKEEKIIRYKYNFNDWKSNSKNYLFTGNISLFEVQDMNKFSFNNNANDNDNNINNNNDDDDDGIKCKLNINTNEGLKWGVSWYDEINYIDTKNPLKKPIKIKPFKQNGYMHTVQRIAPQYYTVVLTYKPENTDNSNTNDNIDDVKKICIGMVLNNIYDDMRLDSNLKEFNQRCEKLKIFRKNYSDDLNKSGSLIDDDTNTSNNVKLDRKNNDSNDYDIESEDDSLHNVQLNSSTINNKDSIIIETENFDIEEEEDDDNDDFGDFVSS